MGDNLGGLLQNRRARLSLQRSVDSFDSFEDADRLAAMAALSMTSVSQLEFDETLELHSCEYFTDHDQDYFSDLTSAQDQDSDSDGEGFFASTPRAFDQQQAAPRCSLKRTYGVFIDAALAAAPARRRLRRRGIDAQLELLRAIIPTDSCTDEKAASVLADTYAYIQKLQRQLTDLHCELGNPDSCVDFRSSWSPPHHRARPYRPTVEVVPTEEGLLRIHIECDKRPGLLVQIVKRLESSGVNVEQATIACAERLVFDAVGSEVDVIKSQDDENLSYISMSAGDVAANLVSLVANDRLGNS